MSTAPLPDFETSLPLCCPVCHGQLDRTAKRCTACARPYLNTAGVLSFLDDATQRLALQDQASDKENAFKDFFKRWPRLYRFLTRVVAPVHYTGLTTEEFLQRFTAEERMVNIGSGASLLHPRVINVDLFPFSNVHIVARAEQLPFVDGSFDVVCCDQVLEHVPQPHALIDELRRITKPGGQIYVGVPFVFPLHPSPKDYSRWSVEGLRSLLRGCEEVESGAHMGPTSGMLVVVAAWLATLFSFGVTPLRKTLNYVFMLTLSPLRFFDILLGRLPGARDVAASSYIVVRK